MPIDFAKIVALFQVPFQNEMKRITDAFEHLAKWLGKKVEKLEKLERSTRQFPHIDFYNEAVTIWVDRSQHRLLAPGTSEPWWTMFTRGGAGFVRGLKRVGTAIEEDVAVISSLGVSAEALTAISDSFDRWNAPTEKAFNFKSQNIFDIFGELGWFFRAVPSSNEQIRQFLRSPLVTFLMTPSNRGRSSESGLAGQLDTVVNYLAAALLLIPVLTAWLAAAIPAFTLAAKFRLLELFKHGQDIVYDFRERLLRWLVQTVTRAAKTVWAFTTSFLKIISDQVRFYIKFAAAFGVLLLINLKTFLKKLVDLFNSWIDTARVIQKVLEIVMRFEINGLLGTIGSFLPRVTIDDLMSVALGHARAWFSGTVQQTLNLLLFGAKAAGRKDLVVQIKALKEIFGIVTTPTPEMKDEPLLAPPGDLFPDISGLLGSGLGAAIRKHGSEVAAGVTSTLEAGGIALRGMGDAFTTAAARAAFIDSQAKFKRIFDDSAAVARYLTEGERSALQQGLAKPNEMALGFEKALINGGFNIVGDSIVFYVKAVREHWDQKLKSSTVPPKPTSAHILQKRKRLARVRMPALTVRARGHKLDSELIAEIASRFKTAVQEAYRKGMVRLEAASAQ